MYHSIQVCQYVRWSLYTQQSGTPLHKSLVQPSHTQSRHVLTRVPIDPPFNHASLHSSFRLLGFNALKTALYLAPVNTVHVDHAEITNTGHKWVSSMLHYHAIMLHYHAIMMLPHWNAV